MTLSVSEVHADMSGREVMISAGLPPEHVEIILDLAAQSGRFTSDALMALEDMAWDTAYGQGAEEHTFLLALANTPQGSLPIGFICFGPIMHWPDQFEMYGIAVVPAFQRMGVGTAFVSEMKRQIASANGKRIFLETGEERAFEGARLFYEDNDFVQEHRFYRQFIPSQGGVVYRFDIDKDDATLQFQ